MFIPIDAKADIKGSKKGKITPAQHAILNSWCLASKTGILDFPQDHSKAGRCEATTLNITNIQNYETEIIFNKGYLVICGRLVECESGTKFVFKTPTTGTETGKIVARFSLGSSGNEEFVITQKTGALVQNDLNDNVVNGVYELELYSYEATPTSVTLTRTQPYVPDIGGKLAQFEASLKDEGKPLHGYDDSKGTIEERLTALGFKEASISVFNSDYIDAESEMLSLGKIIYGNILAKAPKSNINSKPIQNEIVAKAERCLPPNTEIKIGSVIQVKILSSQYGTSVQRTSDFYLNENNEIVLRQTIDGPSGYSGDWIETSKHLVYTRDNLNNKNYF